MPGEVLGMKELSLKLAALGNELGPKVLRQACMAAAKPTSQKIQAAAPVGTKAHKTYKGNTITPGYLQRSVKIRSYKRGGKAGAVIGVLADAFYGITFLDRGISVSKRRKAGKGGSAGGGKSIKPYKITGRKWFKKVFILDTPEIEKRLANQLRTRIAKLTR